MCTPEDRTTAEKIWRLAESGMLWGAIGALVGAVIVMVPLVALKWIFVVSGAILAFRIIAEDFFPGYGKVRNAFCNLALGSLVAVILFLIWYIIPKPKEPPTVDDIANAVIKKEKEQVKSVQDLSPVQDPVKPSEPPKKKPSRPKPQQQQETPNLPSQIPPVQPAKLTVTQTSEVSSRTDAPYKTRVVVQTTSEFPTLKMFVQCDKPLVDGSVGVGSGGGVTMMTSQGIVKERPNLFLFTYQSAMPPFNPANPVVFNLWSAQPVKCDQAATF